MLDSLESRVDRWCDELGIAPSLRPSPSRLALAFGADGRACRAGVSPRKLASWERRFGFRLPDALKAWLRLSDGFQLDRGPLVHPLAAIGPMVPFASVPGLVIQPESWFELGNPSLETICVDLAYHWPQGDCPLFTSGDDERQRAPRLIAPSFADWFLRALHHGGREYWLEPDFPVLGDPWAEHRRWTPPPPLPERLRRLLPSARASIHDQVDERVLASRLGISRLDLESLVRHVQHESPSLPELSASAEV
jgi:hypothetical protein